jgi:FixJ family two-component response regulator
LVREGGSKALGIPESSPARFLASEDQAYQELERASSALKERFKALSSREREIMIQVAQGRLSKQIAGDLGISETTVNMADKLNLLPNKPQISRSRR